MSDKPIRTDLDAALDSRTDWARLRSLDERAIEAGLRADPDSFAAEGSEHIGRAGASAAYHVLQRPDGRFHWQLRAADGAVVAVSAEDFPSRSAAHEAVIRLRDMMLGARSEAA